MVYTVTLNPALDYLMEVPDLQYGDINRSRSEELKVGGKGINVSYILHELGVDTTAVGFSAGFTGAYMEACLARWGIPCRFTPLDRGFTRINVKILPGTDFAVNGKGPDIEEADIKRLIADLAPAQTEDFLVLSGAGVAGGYEAILSSVPGVRAVVDTAGRELLDLMKYKPFLVKPNHKELGALFGVQIETRQAAVDYAEKLRAMGASNVLVSRGKDGAVLLDERGKVHTASVARGKTVSTVGCGDSMVAGFLAGYLQTGDYAYALKLGTACGGATAFSPHLATAGEIARVWNTL